MNFFYILLHLSVNMTSFVIRISISAAAFSFLYPRQSSPLQLTRKGARPLWPTILSGGGARAHFRIPLRTPPKDPGLPAHPQTFDFLFLNALLSLFSSATGHPPLLSCCRFPPFPSTKVSCRTGKVAFPLPHPGSMWWPIRLFKHFDFICLPAHNGF